MGHFVNLSSSRSLWVVETDTNHPTGPAVAHILPPKYQAPLGIDCDGVKAIDGTAIDGHSSWWKIVDYNASVIRDKNSGLTINTVPIPATKVADNEFGTVTFDNAPIWPGSSRVILPFESHDLTESLDGLPESRDVTAEELFQLLVQDQIPTDLLEEARALVNAYDARNVSVDSPSADFESSCSGQQYVKKLGGTSLPNQHRVHRHGLSLKAETRKHSLDVFVRFRHPNICQFFNDAVNCIPWGVAGSIVAAYLSGSVDVAMAAFYPTWKACFVTKVGLTIANNTGVDLYKDDTYTCWTNHC